MADCGCPPPAAPEDARAPSSARRRLIRGGLSAGPVLLALSGKSAMAQATGGVCRFPSTWASIDPNFGGNPAGLSHHNTGSDEGCGFGRSPGFWKQPQKRCYWPFWSLGIGPRSDTLKCGSRTTGNAVCANYNGDGTLVNDVFAMAAGLKETFQQALCTRPGQDIWHFIAAYLNSFTVDGYPLSPSDIVDMWHGNYQVPGTGQFWSRAQARDFIESTYDTDGIDPIWRAGVGCSTTTFISHAKKNAYGNWVPC